MAPLNSVIYKQPYYVISVFIPIMLFSFAMFSTSLCLPQFYGILVDQSSYNS